jgi:site-specific recombinase XerD
VKYFINSRIVLSHAPEGPLATYLDCFATSMSTQGYALGSIHQQVLLAACFSRWLGERRVGLREISSDHVVRYLRYRSRRRRSRSDDGAVLKHCVDFLRGKDVIPADKAAAQRLTAAQRYAQAYEQHLREARALARATIVNYVPFALAFLKDRFGNGHVKLSSLRACDVVSFVQREALRLHRKQAQLMSCALRSFLRYARYRGDVTLDLAAAVPAVANWSMASIPRAITTAQVRQLLTSIDRRTAIGRRDYAIVLLLARLGVRAGEVVLLELDDIDWNDGRLSVHGESGQRNELPLPADVGKAIAAYLRYGRPRSTCRRVFLRTKAPLCGLRAPSSIASIIRDLLERADIHTATYGAHQFRHGLATEMLRQGASLGEIGEILGHRHPQTTTIYTKVDIEALRTLALRWPEGAR